MPAWAVLRNSWGALKSRTRGLAFMSATTARVWLSPGLKSMETGAVCLCKRDPICAYRAPPHHHCQQQRQRGHLGERRLVSPHVCRRGERQRGPRDIFRIILTWRSPSRHRYRRQRPPRNGRRRNECFRRQLLAFAAVRHPAAVNWRRPFMSARLDCAG